MPPALQKAAVTYTPKGTPPAPPVQQRTTANNYPPQSIPWPEKPQVDAETQPEETFVPAPPARQPQTPRQAAPPAQVPRPPAPPAPAPKQAPRVPQGVPPGGAQVRKSPVTYPPPPAAGRTPQRPAGAPEQEPTEELSLDLLRDRLASAQKRAEQKQGAQQPEMFGDPDMAEHEAGVEEN